MAALCRGNYTGILACILAGVAVLAIASMVSAQLLVPEDDPMLGKPAPVVTLDLMGGGTFDLAALKGKVVVIDFFATWCKYCTLSLPVAGRVTAKYKDKDVVFYAIDIGANSGMYHSDEDPAQIKAFLEKLGVEAPVALDSKLDASRKYFVEGPPQTFIIGKDGIVESVERGFPLGARGQRLTREIVDKAVKNAEEELARKLDVLISGKSLVKKAEPTSEAPKK